VHYLVFSQVQIARTPDIPTVANPQHEKVWRATVSPNFSPTKHSDDKIQCITQMNLTMLRPQQSYQAYLCPFAPQKPPDHLPHLPAHQQRLHRLAAALVFEAQVPGFQAVVAESVVVQSVALVRA
jgi:hypothetical protein